MHNSLYPVDYFLALLLLRLFLGDKLDKVQYLAVQEQENVLYLQSALAKPRVAALIELLGDPRFNLAAVFVFLLLI